MEDLAVREERGKKSKWKESAKLQGWLADNQSTWAFKAGPETKGSPSDPPLIRVHAASFLVLTSTRQPRSGVLLVTFPRSRIPPDAVIDDTGSHAFPALDEWHRTLLTEGRRSELAECIAPAVRFRQFSRLELVPLLQAMLDAGLVRESLRDTAERLVLMER